MSAYVILVRLCLAILFAGVIGYDRQRKNRPAGLRPYFSLYRSYRYLHDSSGGLLSKNARLP